MLARENSSYCASCFTGEVIIDWYMHLWVLSKHYMLTDVTFLKQNFDPSTAICCLAWDTWRLSPHFAILQGTLQAHNVSQTLFQRLLKSHSWFLD